MNFKVFSVGIISAAVMAVAMCGTAHAGLIGDTVDLSYLDDGHVQADASGTIPESISFVFANNSSTISNDTLTLNGTGGVGVIYSPGTFSIDLKLLSGPEIITGVTFAGMSNATGFSQSSVSFTSNSIVIDMTNAFINSDGSVTFDIQTAPASVPEPASLVVFGTGVLALGFFGWRRRNRGAI